MNFVVLDDDPIVREALARLAGGGEPEVAMVELAESGSNGDLLRLIEGFGGTVLLSRSAVERAAEEARLLLADDARLEGSPELREACEELLVLERSLEPRPGSRFRLTERERVVLRLMADGATNMEIAARLSISLSTVKSHVAQIMRKLGTRNRANAIVHYLTGRVED